MKTSFKNHEMREVDGVGWISKQRARPSDIAAVILVSAFTAFVLLEVALYFARR